MGEILIPSELPLLAKITKMSVFTITAFEVSQNNGSSLHSRQYTLSSHIRISGRVAVGL